VYFIKKEINGCSQFHIHLAGSKILFQAICPDQLAKLVYRIMYQGKIAPRVMSLSHGNFCKRRLKKRGCPI